MRKIALLAAVFVLSTVSVLAQRVITGRVTDSKDGSPIVGATVKARGENVTTTTGADGTFTLKTKSSSTIDISDVGHTSQTVKVDAGSGLLDIKMVQDPKALSEVVVTGTGVATSKRRVGISVESITADKLPQTPTASIDQALVGKIPGAQISSISGNPGDPVNIVLRGINSLGGTTPLILVDGIQVTGVDLNSLDLNNVDRVEVVQGAASATLYGAQGANGVIQIFTKKGKKGAARIDFSSSYSSNEFLNVGNVQKSKLHPYSTDANGNILQYSTGLPVAINPDGTMPNISYRFGRNIDGSGNPASRTAILGPRNINNQPYNGNLKFYDHFGQVFQKGYTLNNNISISGGGDKSDYNLGISNTVTESPILKNGKLNRTNLSLNLGTELFKGLKLRSTTQVIYTKNNMAPLLGAPGGVGYGIGNQTSTLSSGSYASGVFGFLNTSPFFDLAYRQPDGNYANYLNAGFLSVNSSNPYYYKQYGSGIDNKVEVVQGLNLNYQVNKWVELDAKYGISYRNENAKWTFANQSTNVNTVDNFAWAGVYAPDETGEINNYQYTNTYQNLLTSATFRFDFERDFKIKLPIRSTTLLAYDYRKNVYREYDTYSVGLPLNPPINGSTAGSTNVAFDYYEPFTTYGYLLDQQFQFGDWAGLNAGFRTDWSSNFGDGLNFTFPHVNGYVNLAAFDFIKDKKIGNTVSYLKLRAAYGEAGIQPPFGARYPGINPGNLGGSLAYSFQSSLRNPEIRVERTKETEVGLDFSLNGAKGKWFSAFNGSFTYWKRKSVDVITNVSVALSTGGSSQLKNAVDMSSSGIQAQLNIPVYKSKDFGWDFTVNFSKARSIVDRVDGDVAAFTASAGSTQLKLIAGQPIGQIFGYSALTSVNQLRADKTPFIPADRQGAYQIVDGRVVDTTTKAIFFSDEAGFIGDPNPKFFMSFINGFTYKDFLTFGFQFDWVYGSHLYNQTREWMYRDGIHGDFDKPVTINGQTASYTAYHASAYYSLGNTTFGPGNNATKDYFYEDASFLRLRNISLGFDIAKVAKIPAFRKLQLVFTGRNVLTATKYSGFDPEINSAAANSSFERGIDHSTLPNIRSYQISLNVGF